MKKFIIALFVLVLPSLEILADTPVVVISEFEDRTTSG